MSTLLIVNPAAGRGRAARLAEEAVRAATAAWGPVDRQDTTAPRVAADLVRLAVERGTERVLVLGGDGTLHEAANGLLAAKVERRPPIGILPAGTGNDFAKLAGTVGLSPTEAVKRLAAGRVRLLDVGHAWDEYFLNSVGIGFDAAVAREVAAGGRFTGLPAYLLAVGGLLRRFAADELAVVSTSGSFTDRLLLIEVGVGPIVGGGFRLTPFAQPDDGLFDVCAVREQNVWGILTKLPLAMFGKHTRLKDVRYFRCAHLVIRAPAGLIQVQFDGELRSGQQEMRLRIEPLALPVLVTR